MVAIFCVLTAFNKLHDSLANDFCLKACIFFVFALEWISYHPIEALLTEPLFVMVLCLLCCGDAALMGLL